MCWRSRPPTPAPCVRLIGCADAALSRYVNYTRLVIERATLEDDGTWPFATGVVQKSAATTPFRGKTWQRRREIAERELDASRRLGRSAVGRTTSRRATRPRLAVVWIMKHRALKRR